MLFTSCFITELAEFTQHESELSSTSPIPISQCSSCGRLQKNILYSSWNLTWKKSLRFIHKNFLRSMSLWRLSLNSLGRCVALKVSVFAVILVSIFPHSDWIRRDTPYLSEFSPNVGKCGKNADQNTSKYGLFLRSVW